MSSQTPWDVGRRPALLSGLLAMGLGALYLGHAFGPTEAEVAQWGLVVVVLGALLTLTLLVGGRSPAGLTGIGATGLLVALSVLQPLPIALWLLFHGSGISDGSPPTPFIAHRLFALPHLLLLALAVAGVVRLIPSWKPTYGARQ